MSIVEPGARSPRATDQSVLWHRTSVTSRRGRAPAIASSSCADRALDAFYHPRLRGLKEERTHVPQHAHQHRNAGNLAARMGRWSAAHWKTATFGWLAFVLVAFALGGMVGTKTHRPEHAGAGRVRPHGQDPRRRASSSPPARASSSRARSARAAIPPSRPRSTDVVVEALEAERRPERPLAARSGQRRPDRDGRARGARRVRDPRRPGQGGRQDRPGPRRRRRPRRQLIRASSSASSATRARSMRVVTAYGDDLGKAGMLSLPITLIILVLAFGALVAAGIPLLLALTAVFATFGLIALPSAILPVAMQAPALVLLIGLAVGVDYSMFYLKREREERAAGRSEQAALEAAAATSGRSVLISGLTVMVAMAGMFLTGDQIFASLGVATITVVAVAVLGLADRAARAALEARRQGRPGARPARRPAPPRRRRRPDLGRDRRPRPAAAARVRRPRRRAAGRARRAGAPAPHGHAGARHVPAVAPRRADVRPDAAGVPGHGAAGQRRRQGAERERAGRAGGDRPARAAGARERPHARADHGRRQRGRDRREHHRSRSTARGPTATSNAALARAPRRDRPRDGRRAPGRRGRRHRARGAVEGRRRRDEVEPAARRRVRARCSRSR